MQRQVDEFLEKERLEKEKRIKEEQIKEQKIKEEKINEQKIKEERQKEVSTYQKPYQHPPIPPEAYCDDDDEEERELHLDWSAILMQNTIRKLETSSSYPPLSPNIFNNNDDDTSKKDDVNSNNDMSDDDDEDFEDAISENSNFEDPMDEEGDEEHPEEADEEVTESGDDQEEHGHVQENNNNHGQHYGDDQEQDDVPGMQHGQDVVFPPRPVITARNTIDNSSNISNVLIPVDYGGIAHQKQILKDKLYELGSRQLSFGKYAKFELWWVVKNDPGYINWCSRTPQPSNWLQHFLMDVNRYLDLKVKWDRVRTLDWELYAVNSSAHPEEWVPWLESDCAKDNRNPTDQRCPHEMIKRSANQHGYFWKCTHCSKQLCYIPHQTAHGSPRRPIWFAGVVQIPVNYQKNSGKAMDISIIMDSGCRRSVAGTEWHIQMIRWCRKYGLQPQTKSIKEAFEFGGGEVVHSNRALIYPILLNGHLVELDVAEVDRCPPLLSSQAMRSLGMELNYATGQINIHSCDFRVPLTENHGGHPVLKFPKPTQDDIIKVPRKYLKVSEMKETNTINKVTFKDDDENLDSFVYDADTTVIKKGTRKKLAANIKDAIEAFEEGAKERPLPEPVWHVDKMAMIKTKRRLSIMEICTWTMMVTSIAIQRGWETWQPITIESGYDLTTNKGIEMAKIDIEKANPDVIVFAWVCTPWTLMQNLNSKVPGHAERLAHQRELHSKMLSFAEWCERRQSAHGGLFLGENPMGSVAWQQPPCMRMSRRCYEAKLDQCMFGLKAPDTQEPIKKATKMLTTSRCAARNLSLRCDGHHQHRTIGGQITYKDKSGKFIRQSLSEYCGGYTKELATAMVQGFEEDLLPISHFTNVVSRKRALDELEEEAARRVARRVGEDPASSSTDIDKKRKRRKEFAEELRELTKRAKMPRPTTRSMARSSASQPEDDDQEEIPVTQMEEAVRHWYDDMEEEIPYHLPEQEQEDTYEETPTTAPENQNYHHHQEPEDTPYPHDHHQDPMDMDEEVPAQLYYPNDAPPRRDETERVPGPDHLREPVREHHEEEDGHHHGHDETPQFIPEPGQPRPDVEMVPREEILNDLEFYGNDLAGGEGDVPGIIVWNVPPEVRREVRNAHYNLGHPSTATLLRLMRRAGANDAVQRYARWWKCPQCSERQAPGATPSTTAPYRPRTFNLMAGCDMKVVHDH